MTARPSVGPGEADGAGEHPVGDARERPRHLLEAVQADEVPGGDPEQAETLAPDEVLDVGRLRRDPSAISSARRRRRAPARPSAAGSVDDHPRQANGSPPRRRRTWRRGRARTPAVPGLPGTSGESWSATRRTVSGAAEARASSSGSCGDGIGGAVLCARGYCSHRRLRSSGGRSRRSPGRQPSAAGRIWRRGQPARRPVPAGRHRRRPRGQRREGHRSPGRGRGGGSGPGGVPRARPHRLPARGPAARSRALSRATCSLSRRSRQRRSVARRSSASSRRTAISTTPPPSVPAGEVRGIVRKQLLPNYGVFDERRYFAPGRRVRTSSS